MKRYIAGYQKKKKHVNWKIKKYFKIHKILTTSF